MTPLPRVSVALCTYNGAAYLESQLDSILGQRGVELDVVAVDDASGDATWDLLCARASRDPRLKVHRNVRNLGLVRNFERALGLCNGDFIAPSDQDDVWEPDKLCSLVEAIGGHDLAYCDAALIDAQGRPMSRRTSDGRQMIGGRDPVAFTFRNCVSGHAMLVRRALLDRALPFPPVQLHDAWLAFVAASGEGLVYVDRPLVRFRQHAASQTDMSRSRKLAASPKDQSQAFARRVAWVEALATHPGVHRAFFTALARSMRRLEQRWFSPRVLALLWPHRRSIARIWRKASRRPVREILWHACGPRLRRLLD